MDPIRRRQFLLGAGGFTLALPFLPSLMPRNAQAQATGQPRRFVALATHHGGIWNGSMYPATPTLTNTMNYAGHEVRWGNLALQTNSGRSSLSPVLSANSAALTDAIAAKMMVIQGVDVPWYIAHHTGGHLGNYGRNDGNDPDTGITEFRPTIDQIMAWSDTFYPDLSNILERSLVIGSGRLSYNWSSPSTREGTIQDIAAEASSLALFNRIFVPQDDPTSARTPVVDRVLENYQRLRTGNRRLSVKDRQRLDDHMDRLFELQRRLNATVSCSDVPMPSMDSRSVRNNDATYSFNPDTMETFWQLHNDVIAAAFTCDSCRVVTMHCGDTFSTFQGDWHQDVAHKANLPTGIEQEVIATAHRLFFENVFLDLVNKLEIDEGDGTTILDNSLVQWSQESGNHTHHSFSIPLITAGSAGGFFNTGRYVDYRNLGIVKAAGENAGEPMNPGLIHNQWLANIAMSMGLPRAEYDLDGHGGYGILYVHPVDNWYAKPEWWPNSVQAEVGNRLPIITS